MIPVAKGLDNKAARSMTRVDFDLGSPNRKIHEGQKVQLNGPEWAMREICTQMP